MKRALSTITAALVALAAVCTGSAAHASAPRATPADVTTASVTVTAADGLQLAGTVFRPAGDPRTQLPGLVLVHGSGNGLRETLMPEAIAFARQGIAVLAYDKRSLSLPDFEVYADDALAAVATLRREPGVDPALVGLWGISEGGWVVPLAAGRGPDVAFLIPVSAPALSPLRTQNWNMRNKLDRAGITGGLAATLSERMYRLVTDAGLFGEATYEPGPVLAALHQPTLAVFGTDDTQVPATESAELFRRTVSAPLSVRFLPGPHPLRLLDQQGGVTDTLVPGYADLVGGWVRAVAAGRTPLVSESGPAQPRVSAPLTPSRWWESWIAQLLALGVMLAGFLAYPVVAAVRRLRDRRVPVTGAARALAVIGPVAVLGLPAYAVGVHAATNSQGVQAGPMLAGRPLLWLVLQLLAITTVLATGFTAVAWRRARADRVRMAALLTGSAVFLPWALYWALLLP